MDLKAINSTDKVVETYIRYKDVKRASKNLYKSGLKRYTQYLADHRIDLNKTDSLTIQGYRDSLVADGLSERTISGYMVTVKDLYNWLDTNNLYPNAYRGISKLKIKREFKKHPLSVKDIQRFLGVAYRILPLRDYAILNLISRTGLRTIEVTRLTIDDIQYREGARVLRVHGKGRESKDDFVLLEDKAYEPIKAYLESRGFTHKTEPLFTSESNRTKGSAISTRHIREIGSKIFNAIGIKTPSISVHSLRHSVGTHILMNGGTLEDVQNTLRHSSAETTKIYLKTVSDIHRINRNAESIISQLY